ncbi:MAG TPA: hypothetical protein VFU50_04935 [Terriglobales bacterium]|nr:hypothetical protein [Terriglobales bacterium]
MSVEKQTLLRSKLEDLRQEREKLRHEVEDRLKKIGEIDNVIRKFLQLKQNTITEERARRAQKKK